MSTTSQFFGGSGGGLPPIDSAVMLNRTDDVATIDTAVFLKSGVVETDVTVYPDAFALPANARLTTVTTNTLSVTAQETNPKDLVFKPDGLEVYIAGATGDDITQYTLTTAFDLSTATFTRAAAPASLPGISGITFNDTGEYVFLSDGTGDTVTRYTCSTPWNISGISFPQQTLAMATTNPNGLTFNNDGTRLFVIDSSSRVNRYDLSTAYDLTTSTYMGNTSFVGTNQIGASGTGVSFNADGTMLFLTSPSRFYLTPLSTPYDPSSFTQAAFVPAFLIVSDTQGVYARSNTSVFLVSGLSAPAKVTEYTTPVSYVGSMSGYTLNEVNRYVRVA